MSDSPETDALIESCDQHKPHTNFGEALKLARSLERRLQEAQREHGETLVEYELEMSELRKLLTHAVAHIRAWHGMNLPEDQEPALWEIYWNNAPEMKPLRAALAEKGKP